MRKYGKVDDAQAPIVRALRQCGASVQSIASVGLGVPDVLVGVRGVNYLLEIKTGGEGLTVAETEWHHSWRGGVCVVRSVDEALRAVGLMR